MVSYCLSKSPRILDEYTVINNEYEVICDLHQ